MPLHYAAAATGIPRRQLWNLPSSTTTYSAHCTPFTLPSGGVLSLASSVITLTTDIAFQPQCTGYLTEGISTVDKLMNPFYASVTPQTYVIAATTVIAWVLVVMLIITPRTSFIGNPSANPGFSNGRGLIGGATGGGTNLIGVGSRPWLQKAAALTVAVALTIATADTFKQARIQYEIGYMNADSLRDKVLGSLEIRITRVISDVFVWLAQVQTLIRLFPRHKEKVLIKWIGFALIICDSTFSCLNSFLIDNQNRPGHFVDAIPALSYLFELALGLLYAAWVWYYAMTKRRYAFYHHKMRSICLIALLSIIAVMTPVVFFVTDVSNQDIAGWGDYFRWAGAAAASVVVWEWVERIEALERDEKKDGILGREIFDGDEMLDVGPSEEAVWSQGRHRRGRLRLGGDDGSDGAGGGIGANASSALEHGLNGVAQRFRKTRPAQPEHFALGRAHSSTTSGATPDPTHIKNENGRIAFGHLPKPEDRGSSQAPILGHPTPPLPVANPPSRADTTSAASTVYVVRYDTAADVPQPARRRADRDTNGNTAQTHAVVEAQRRRSLARDSEKEEAPTADREDEPQPNRDRDRNGNRDQGKWYTVANPFKRKRASPPAEIQQARAQARQEAAERGSQSRTVTPAHNFSRWDLKNRLGVLAAETGDRFRDRADRGGNEEVEQPVIVIPAQPRGSGRTWSPEIFNQQQRGGTATPPADRGFDGSTAVASSSSLTPGRADPRSPLPIQGSMIPSTTVPAQGSSSSRASNPPRADDISPVNGSSQSPVIVPAPRRSPLHITTVAPGVAWHGLGEDGAAGASRPGRND